MMKYAASVLCVFGILISTAQAQAPSWNAAQTEAWAVVQQSWKDEIEENGKWPSDYLHANAVSWGADDPAPQYRDTIIRWTRFNNEASDIVMHEIYPVAIATAGDTAVVHYIVSLVTEDKDKERATEHERIREVLVRENGTWKFLSLGDYPISLPGE